ncbi:GNAT family N-acetyltransferase [Kineosporia succinea]|uniref:Lysine N-acyltransferase MbtK n=1 Tax=Kineosporia succinea TaxID=84632 RepID=A0ABT9P590_9ACTN|nr:GNAT family N-acetyltransferase [Kineosporia succinea]MDP9827716.1 RimJ/RimL family protein N-acetyltransferase [Kineosporia succinea]
MSPEPVLTREIREGLPAAVLATSAPAVPSLPFPWQARLLRPGSTDEARLVHWMAQPHVERFWQQDWPADRWNGYLRAQIAGAYSRPVLVLRDGEPFAYLEIYRPARDLISGYYPAGPHDLGLHLAIGDQRHTGRGFGREMVKSLVAQLFTDDPACELVVAEPDARNVAAVRMFEAAGFRRQAELELPHKTAALMVTVRSAR